MRTNVFRFQFEHSVPFEEVESSLYLSLLAVEGLFGKTRVLLDASCYTDEPHRTVFVDGTNEIGEAIVRVFTNLLLGEFGKHAFEVRRVEASLAPRTEGRAV